MHKIDIRGLLIRISIFFIVLTGLNVVIFSIMAFVNQSNLILDLAIASSHNKGITIHKKIEDVLNVSQLLTKRDWQTLSNLFVDKKFLTMQQINEVQNELKTKNTLTKEEYNEIYKVLHISDLNVIKFKIFDQQGTVLYSKGYSPSEANIATELERNRIVKAIFSKDYEQRAFYNENVQEWRYIDIYIPFSIGLKNIIIKPTIDEVLINKNINTFFKQSIFAGIFMLIAHVGFILIAYNIIVKPLRQVNKVLETQNITLEKQRNELLYLNNELNDELEMAQILQQSILLQDIPKYTTFNFGHIYIGMNRVSGDYIDMIKIDDAHVGLLIVDVSGHGVPSALITTMAKVSFNTHSTSGISTSEICTRVNQDLYKAISDSDYYLTAFYAIYNIETNELTYTSAGHCNPIIYRYLTHEIEEITTQGFFIGSFDFSHFESKKTFLEHGDKLVLFTDGIIEAVNEEGELYDYRRLYKFIAKNVYVEAKTFSNALLEDVRKFVGDAKVNDDIALMVLEVTRDGNGKKNIKAITSTNTEEVTEETNKEPITIS